MRLCNQEDIKEINLEIARRIGLRRLQLGISRKELGAAIGVSLQQVHKYENGKNQISSAALYKIAKYLQVSVVNLLPKQRSLNDIDSSPLEEFNTYDIDVFNIKKRLNVRLVNAVFEIENEIFKKSIIDLIMSMASQNNHKNEFIC